MAPRSVSRRAAALAAALLLASCTSQETPTPNDQPLNNNAAPATTEGYLLTEASYTLTWNTAGTTLLPDGSRELSTDQGYTVQIHRGYLLSWNTSLAACDGLMAQQTPQPSQAPPAVQLLDLLLAASPAHAGHSTGLDPSTVGGPFAESLTEAASLDLTAPTFPKEDYCRLHYAIGNAGLPAAGTPEDLDLTLTSLYLELSWQAPDGTQTEVHTFQTSTAYGLLLNLHDLGAHEEPLTGQERAHLTFTRPLAQLFDGLALDQLEEEDLLRAMLRNLSAHTAVQLELSVPHSAQNAGE